MFRSRHGTIDQRVSRLRPGKLAALRILDASRKGRERERSPPHVTTKVAVAVNNNGEAWLAGLLRGMLAPQARYRRGNWGERGLVARRLPPPNRFSMRKSRYRGYIPPNKLLGCNLS